MTEQTELSTLRRKAGTGRAPSDGAGMTPAKAFRLAVSKASEVELGLAARAQTIKEEPLRSAAIAGSAGWGGSVIDAGGAA